MLQIDFVLNGQVQYSTTYQEKDLNQFKISFAQDKKIQKKRPNQKKEDGIFKEIKFSNNIISQQISDDFIEEELEDVDKLNLEFTDSYIEEEMPELNDEQSIDLNLDQDNSSESLSSFFHQKKQKAITKRQQAIFTGISSTSELGNKKKKKVLSEKEIILKQQKDAERRLKHQEMQENLKIETMNQVLNAKSNKVKVKKNNKLEIKGPKIVYISKINGSQLLIPKDYKLF